MFDFTVKKALNCQITYFETNIGKKSAPKILRSIKIG